MGIWFQSLISSLGLMVTAGTAWYQWRAQVELPPAEAELQAAGYSLDIVQACAPELPEAGNFGATPLLKGIATREEGLTPELKERIEKMRGQQNPATQGLVMAVFDRTKASRIRSFLDEIQALKSGGLLGYYRRTKELDDLPDPGWRGLLQPHELLVRGARSGYSALMPGLIHTEMRRRLLLVACALERHRLAGGAPPDALTALPKNLLPQIPPDLDGQPLRFLRDKDGWVLWSVGIDLKDDWNGNIPPSPADAVKDLPGEVFGLTRCGGLQPPSVKPPPHADSTVSGQDTRSLHSGGYKPPLRCGRLPSMKPDARCTQH